MEKLNLSQLKEDHTMLIIIDMNNGFAKEGNLYSDRVEAIVEPIVTLAETAISRGVKTLAYTDFHKEDSREFGAYPSHCVGGTKESELVDGLKQLTQVGMEVIHKNSTNGVLAYNPAEHMVGIEHYIIVGCVTDICVYQYATTLRAYLNEHELEGTVYVSKKHVATYHIEGIHEGDLYEKMALSSMEMNGIMVVEDIVMD